MWQITVHLKNKTSFTRTVEDDQYYIEDLIKVYAANRVEKVSWRKLSPIQEVARNNLEEYKKQSDEAFLERAEINRRLEKF